MYIYFAAPPNKAVFTYLKEQGARNFLFSYAKIKDYLKFFHLLEPEDRVIIDSGAFSAWTKKQKIDLDEYIKCCKQLKKDLPCKELTFINLDKIPGEFGKKPTTRDIEESALIGWANYEKMQKSGLKVMHIFHQHEDFKWLKKLAKSSDYIGVSPANDLSIKKRMAWLAKVFKYLGATKKTHCFGLVAINVIKKIPFYSGDSTSWNTPARYGQIQVYKNFKTQTGSYRNPRVAFRAGLNKDSIINYIPRMKPNILSFLRMEKDVTRLWKKRGVRW